MHTASRALGLGVEKRAGMFEYYGWYASNAE
jgi:hypothetical protein